MTLHWVERTQLEERHVESHFPQGHQKGLLISEGSVRDQQVIPSLTHTTCWAASMAGDRVAVTGTFWNAKYEFSAISKLLHCFS